MDLEFVGWEGGSLCYLFPTLQGLLPIPSFPPSSPPFLSPSPLLHSVRDGLQINKYHQWFNGMVNGWVRMATNRCKSRIQQAIQLDQVRDT